MFSNGWTWNKAQHTVTAISRFPQKLENRIPWLFHDWFASFHDSRSHMVSDMVMFVPHNMHNNHKLESCHSHENKQFHDFSMTFWKIFTFQDFSMTFHDTIFSRIFHDRGNPAFACVKSACTATARLQNKQVEETRGRAAWTVWLSILICRHERERQQESCTLHSDRVARLCSCTALWQGS